MAAAPQALAGDIWALSAAELKQAFPAATRAADSARVLQVSRVTLAGRRWDRADFHFDERQQLTRVTLWTSQRTYAQLETELSDRNSPLWEIGGAGVRTPAGQARLCDYGSSVSLSFEPPRRLPQGMMVAAR